MVVVLGAAPQAFVPPDVLPPDPEPQFNLTVLVQEIEDNMENITSSLEMCCNDPTSDLVDVCCNATLQETTVVSDDDPLLGPVDDTSSTSTTTPAADTSSTTTPDMDTESTTLPVADTSTDMGPEVSSTADMPSVPPSTSSVDPTIPASGGNRLHHYHLFIHLFCPIFLHV